MVHQLHRVGSQVRLYVVNYHTYRYIGYRNEESQDGSGRGKGAMPMSNHVGVYRSRDDCASSRALTGRLLAARGQLHAEPYAELAPTTTGTGTSGR